MPAKPQVDVIAPILVKVIGFFLVTVAVVAWAYRRLGGRPLWAKEPRPVVPWGSASVAGVAALYLGLLTLTGLLRDRLLANTLAAIGVAGLAPFLLRATSGARLADLGLTGRDLGRNILRGAAACALVLPLVYFVQYEASRVWKPESHPVETVVAAGSSVASVLVAVFGALVAAPLGEEVLFRGVLLGALWKTGSPGADLAANVLVSLIFAVLHSAQWPAPIPLFVLSMAFGEVYRRSGSLVAPIAMHACFNGLSATALLIGTVSGAVTSPS